MLPKSMLTAAAKVAAARSELALQPTFAKLRAAPNTGKRLANQDFKARLQSLSEADPRLDVTVASSNIRPLFMPVFILEFPRFGANFRVFVCGSTGRVGGEAHTSPLKAYVASGTVVTAVLSSLPLDFL